jgi:homoserine dehydrogenase
MNSTGVALVGLGTVGSGVAKLLLGHAERIGQRAGQRMELRQVVVRDPSKPRDVELPAGMLSGDLKRITNDPTISVVAHLVGGLEPARTIMLALLESGKDVVTANKALLAEHGPEIFDRARALNRSIAFDAAVGGGIPIITNISQCLSANQILSLTGILNGTSNFILTQMEEHGAKYEAAVAEAQRLGFAEADPTMDVDGSDATQKIAILSHLAFGSRIDWRTIPRTGINTLDIADMKYARELGYRIKLVANAQLKDDKLQIHVSPNMVKVGTPLAEVRGAHNAITVEGNAVGRLLFHGLGAGQMPTASAVLADMIDMVNGRAKITFRTLELWKQQPAPFTPSDFTQASGKFYLRFSVADKPGVMAEITSILGQHQVSIASIIQHETTDANGAVPLVIMTHTTTEGAVTAAFNQIAKLSSMKSPAVKMRVLA